MKTRDQMWVDPRLIDLATAEASRLKRALLLDTVDSKEVYRSLLHIAIEYALNDTDG